MSDQFKREMSDKERAFFLGSDWIQIAKPFLNDLKTSVEHNSGKQNDDEKEWFRFQGDIRRLTLLLDIDVMLRRSIEQKEK